MPFQQDNRLPTPGLEPCIDAIRLSGDFVQQPLIAVNFGAAGSADLNKCEASLIGRVKLQEALDPAKSFEDTLRVIHAVDSHPKQSGLDAQLIAQRGALFVHRATLLRLTLFVLLRDTDGVGANARHMATPVDGEPVPFRQSFDRAIDGRKKVVAMRLRVETDQIRS